MIESCSCGAASCACSSEPFLHDNIRAGSMTTIVGTAAISAQRTWSQAVELFDRVGLTAPSTGGKYTVAELNHKLSALRLNPSTAIEVKTAVLNCHLLGA
jgi:hypothetical protein